MSKPVVVVTDYVFPNLEPTERIMAELGAELRVAKSRETEDVLAVSRDADGIISCYSDMNAEVIAQLDNCKVIARTGTGYNNIDVDAATKAGMYVTNVRAYCDDEVSDQAMALLLSLARKITFMNSEVQDGRWDEGSAKPLHRIRGKVLGLAGFGNIPRQVAVKAQGFGIDVIAYDPYVDDETYASLGVRGVSLDEMIQQADYFSVHAPLNDETHNMFNADAFARMKPGALVVNTARGELIDVEALADALDSGQVAGAGLDVLPDEPPASDLRLLGRDNVILTPHVGFYSEDSVVDLQTLTAEQVASVIRGEKPQFAVNAAALGR
ncbi:MAG: C-terminal binding protein [Acidimicrobiia bacterium]|nr:C-terminal binding protein [Acidimicrobiia bacterium]